MDREAVYLYLLCFVQDRYQRLNDNLLGAICSLVRRYVEEVDAATKEAIYRFKLQTSADIEQGAKVRDPETGRPPKVTVKGRNLNNLSIEVQGSEEVINRVKRRLA